VLALAGKQVQNPQLSPVLRLGDCETIAGAWSRRKAQLRAAAAGQHHAEKSERPGIRSRRVSACGLPTAPVVVEGVCDG
jgi:hypothetical protein